MTPHDPSFKRRARLLQQSQTGVIIGLIVVFGMVLGLLNYGSPAETGGSSSFLPNQLVGPGQVEGQQLYNQYCFGCHGLTGAGNEAANIPPLNQDGAAWTKSRAELRDHILDGGETMPELSGLVSPEDASDLIAYIQIWWTPEQIDTFNENNPQE